jgi:hypothetical protein
LAQGGGLVHYRNGVFYTLVAMMLNALDAPVPGGAKALG